MIRLIFLQTNMTASYSLLRSHPACAYNDGYALDTLMQCDLYHDSNGKRYRDNPVCNDQVDCIVCTHSYLEANDGHRLASGCQHD